MAFRNRPNKRTRPSTLLLGLALLVLFSSTTIFTVVISIQALEFILQSVTSAIGLWDFPSGYFPTLDYGNVSPFGTDSTFLSCAPTATLTINVWFLFLNSLIALAEYRCLKIVLGDAIVCWRACVLCRGNRTIMGVCIMLLLTTFGMYVRVLRQYCDVEILFLFTALGTVDTAYACNGGGSWEPDPHATGTGSLYSGFSYGLAATALSLGTNLFATVVMAVKAWYAPFISNLSWHTW